MVTTVCSVNIQNCRYLENLCVCKSTLLTSIFNTIIHIMKHALPEKYTLIYNANFPPPLPCSYKKSTLQCIAQTTCSIHDMVSVCNVFMYLCTYVHTYVRTYVHTNEHTNEHTYIHTYVRTYVCMYVCLCVYDEIV